MDVSVIGAAGSGVSFFSDMIASARGNPTVLAIWAILGIASVWSWAVIIDKQLHFGALRSKARRFNSDYTSARSLEDLNDKLTNDARRSRGEAVDPLPGLFFAAMREFKNGSAHASGSALLTLQQRIDRAMGVVAMNEIAKAERGLGVLASVGSASPFIGLFGTVIGIMNAFTAIGDANSTNLAVVAPYIAEALFATALGLFAAIPAMTFYNKFASDAAKFAGQLESFADEFSNHLSRRMQDRGT
ncbi:MAG: MotA/TolQ/ExbB proton channel family protein [Maricaulaceae bacterium]|jgi:biopolymer transport protein TolQ